MIIHEKGVLAVRERTLVEGVDNLIFMENIMNQNMT